jgi:hypothetical protein
MNPDGIAYLDMGEAFMRGDWTMAINGYWSPLYSWLLGLALRVLAPAPQWEFPVVHAVNFVIFVGALASFDFFWQRVIEWNRQKDAGEAGILGLPQWAWQVLGFALFVWTATQWIEVWAVTPDMCVAAFLYLAAGLLVRIRAGSGHPRVFAALGAVLGLGYLSKAAMFPLALVLLASAFALKGRFRGAVRATAIALVAFLAVAGPFVLALSQAKGHFTFGEAGRLNYLWFVNGLPSPHWQGGPTEYGTPLHPTRRVSTEPPIYEFDGPVQGTYPPWYDSSYWYEGATPSFDLTKQVRVLTGSVFILLDLFLRQQAAAVAVACLLFIVGATDRPILRSISRSWFLLVPPLAAMGMYSLVLVETRYIGAFVTMFWAGILSAIRLPDTAGSKRLLSAASLSVLLLAVANVGLFNLEGLGAFRGRQLGFADPASKQQPSSAGSPAEIAEGLGNLGIRPGDKIAIIGYGFDAYWARLARVRIVAELYPWEAEGLWRSDGAVLSRVVETFAETGARAIVAESIPGRPIPQGWLRIGNTSHYARMIDEREI